MKSLYLDLENGYKHYVEMKFDYPEVYAEQQAEMKEYFESGKYYWMKKVYEKKCPVCEDTFYTTTHNQIYDTERCKETARRWRKRTVILNECAICGKLFAPRRKDASYCSGRCRQKAYRYRKTNMATVT